MKRPNKTETGRNARKLTVLNQPINAHTDIQIVITHFYDVDSWQKYSSFYKGKNPNTSFQCYDCSEYSEAIALLKEKASKECVMHSVSGDKKEKVIVQLLTKFGEIWECKQQLTISNF